MWKQKSFKDGKRKSGTLYLVPTPIGNLEDITFRALNVLKDVNLIASEDTRNTQKLLNHSDIQTPQMSFHEHNLQMRLPQMIDILNRGESIAQVSDAGMPSISDPGFELVQKCIEEEIAVVALPGATAGLTALIASGLSPQPHTFYGFLPRKKKEQLEFLTKLLLEMNTMIFYESPHRLKVTVANMNQIFGEKRQVVLCRELTKIHEEYLRGTLEELNDYLLDHPIKGECCLLVAGNDVDTSELEYQYDWKQLSIEEHVHYFVEEMGMSTNEAIKQVAKLRQLKKQSVYKVIHHSGETTE